MAELTGKKVAILATDMFEQVEMVEPRKAVEQAGADVELISLEQGEIQGFNHYDKADRFPVDKVVTDVSADDYDALLLPGGVGNPDTMRADENAVRFVRSFFEQGKPVAAICTRRGCWSRRTSSEAASSRRSGASRRTSETQAATGSTRRSSSTRGW